MATNVDVDALALGSVGVTGQPHFNKSNDCGGVCMSILALSFVGLCLLDMLSIFPSLPLRPTPAFRPASSLSSQITRLALRLGWVE